MIPSDRPARWLETASRIARTAAITTVTAIGGLTLAAIVLWDADFHAARDRWESFKIAMFGEWMPGSADDRPMRPVLGRASAWTIGDSVMPEQGP